MCCFKNWPLSTLFAFHHQTTEHVNHLKFTLDEYVLDLVSISVGAIKWLVLVRSVQSSITGPFTLCLPLLVLWDAYDLKLVFLICLLSTVTLSG